MTLHSYVRTLTLFPPFHILSSLPIQLPPPNARSEAQPLHKQKKESHKMFQGCRIKKNRRGKNTRKRDAGHTSLHTHSLTHTLCLFSRPISATKASRTRRVSVLLPLLPLFLHRVPTPSAGISPAAHAGGPYPAIQPERPFPAVH